MGPSPSPTLSSRPESWHRTPCRPCWDPPCLCCPPLRYPSDLSAFSRSHLPGPWDPARAGTRMKLPQPQTWDRQLSQRGNKAVVWEELIGKEGLHGGLRLPPVVP